MKRLAAIIGIGIGLRAAWALLSHSVAISDAAGYRQVALSLANGYGDAINGHPSAWWVPGYYAWLAVFYALFGPLDGPAIIANILLGGLAILLTYLLARRIVGPTGGLIAAFLMATDPNLIILPRLLLTENLAIPLTLAILLLALHLTPSRRPLSSALLVGAAIGLGMLVREQSMLLIPALGLYWLRFAGWRSLPRLGVLLVGVALVIAPWIARNEAVVGVPDLATTSGINWYVAFNPTADGNWENPPWIGQGSEAEQYRLGKSEAEAYLVGHPLAVLRLAPARLMLFLVPTDWTSWWNQDANGEPSVPPLALQIATSAMSLWYFVVVYLTLVAFVTRRVTRADALLPLAFLGATVAMQCVVYGSPRFRAEIMPIVVLLASSAVLPRVEGASFKASRSPGGLYRFVRRSFPGRRENAEPVGVSPSLPQSR